MCGMGHSRVHLRSPLQCRLDMHLNPPASKTMRIGGWDSGSHPRRRLRESPPGPEMACAGPRTMRPSRGPLPAGSRTADEVPPVPVDCDFDPFFLNPSD